jgi:hypothetical protein
MTDHRNRYPGAQPFSDDDFSRKVFFGRESAARVLADKILANRMVTVYARSGLGKTSLLQAGVAPLLRREGCLPLFVRVNDVRIGPFHALLETIPARRRGSTSSMCLGSRSRFGVSSKPPSSGVKTSCSRRC